MNPETPVCAKCYSNGKDDPGKDWQQMAYLPRAAWIDEDTYLSDAPDAMFDKTIVWCSTPCAVGYFMDVAVRLVREAEKSRGAEVAR
jgi:hypothetical protein